MAGRKIRLISSLLFALLQIILWSIVSGVPAPEGLQSGVGTIPEDEKDEDGVPLNLLPLDDNFPEIKQNANQSPTPEVINIEDESEEIEVTQDGNYTGKSIDIQPEKPTNNKDSKSSKEGEAIYDDVNDRLISVTTSLPGQDNVEKNGVSGRSIRDVSGIEDDVGEAGENDSKKLAHMSHVDKIKYILQPVGPIAEKEKIMTHFYHRFTNNPRENVKWREPVFLSNCWGQAMLSTRYSFAPSCNEDGTFGPKQCYLERCWCVNPNGSNQVRNPRTRFHYKLDGILLKCYQNRLP